MRGVFRHLAGWNDADSELKWQRLQYLKLKTRASKLRNDFVSHKKWSFFFYLVIRRDVKNRERNWTKSFPVSLSVTLFFLPYPADTVIGWKAVFLLFQLQFIMDRVNDMGWISGKETHCSTLEHFIFRDKSGLCIYFHVFVESVNYRLSRKEMGKFP